MQVKQRERLRFRPLQQPDHPADSLPVQLFVLPFGRKSDRRPLEGSYAIFRGRLGAEERESIHINSDAWQRLLSQTALAMSLAVVVPVPLDGSDSATSGVHLREAIRKVNDGEYRDAVNAARMALEDLGTSWAAEKSVVSTARDKRTLDQRLSLLRHSLFSLASAAAHNDEITKAITWDRENALAVIAGVSALAACSRQVT